MSLQVQDRVAQALADGGPVVALESTVITHGMPIPLNLEIAQGMEAQIRDRGAVPATIAIVDGIARVGLSEQELETLALNADARKISLRDLPAAAAKGWSGGTTVAATIHLAHRAGIEVFATGGIGGVHRGHPEDVSADLQALATTPITVVCAGAKAILDLPRTLEVLETLGVPVIGYRSAFFPSFTSRSSGLPVSVRVESPSEICAMITARQRLGLTAALLVCVPISAEAEFPAAEAEAEIQSAVVEADQQGISGKDLTPFLLARLADLSAGRSRDANQALLMENARTAAEIARALKADR